MKPFRQLRESDFLEDLQVNFIGAVRVMHLALSRLQRHARQNRIHEIHQDGIRRRFSSFGYHLPACLQHDP